MNFLNEIALAFPEAVSFAPGRPIESTFQAEDYGPALQEYVDAVARTTKRSTRAVWDSLGQYGRTNGIIADVIATHLALDEGIKVDPGAVIVTVGAQEAMAITLMGLFEPGRDILLASDPTYVGMTALAALLGIRVVSVPSGPCGLDPMVVEEAIATTSREGRVRALYDIPDFSNPCGTSLSLEARHEVLELCRARDVLIIEDNPYGMFAYDRPRLPTLKALDPVQVLYVGSFAKTICPALRVGYLVAGQRTTSGESLSEALSRVKSYTTVNTPALPQTIVAALLSRAGGSLEPIVAPKRAVYKAQRDAMVAALSEAFSEDSSEVTWSRPQGGFFLTLNLPFECSIDEARKCAERYGVIVTPMRAFSADDARLRQIRLSFSYVDPDRIHLGVRRLASFVHDAVAARTETAGAAFLSR